jgi:hemolysin (HlyC) family protein
MNDTDQPGAAAIRPHRAKSDSQTDIEPGSRSKSPAPTLWRRIADLINPKPVPLRDVLRKALRDPSTNGFSDSERMLIDNVLNLSNVRVGDVMVPRADIESVNSGDTIADLVNQFRRAEHSRLPVFRDNLDQIIGMIHIKDLVGHLAAEVPDAEGRKLPVRLRTSLLRTPINKTELARSVLYVPPSMPVPDLLQSMQATRIHMAIVVDEYGGTDGLVTIEDMLESVVGEIEDEHDDDGEDHVRATSEGVYIADARASLVELREIIGPDFEVGATGEEVSSLGGLVVTLLGRVPVRGELISKLRGFELEILAADPRRVRKVRICRRRRPTRARPRTPPVQKGGHQVPAGPVTTLPAGKDPIDAG